MFLHEGNLKTLWVREVYTWYIFKQVGIRGNTMMKL